MAKHGIFGIFWFIIFETSAGNGVLEGFLIAQARSPGNLRCFSEFFLGPFCLVIYSVLGFCGIPASPASQPASPAQPAQPARPASPAFFSCFYAQSASWGSETDVLCERGGNGDWAGSLVACVLPYKMLLGSQKRACRARVVQQAV